MSGLRKRTRAGVYEGEGSVRVFRGKVLSVNKVTWTCKVQPEGSILPIDGVSVEPWRINGRNGSGSFWMPEANTLVWLCTPSADATPFILSGATAPKNTDEGDANEDPNDRRMNRAVLNEGDCALAVSEQGHVIMRRGGVLELGAGEDCKRTYIPLTNIIREFSQNWEHRTGGGLISFLTRDQDELFGADRTPSEFILQVREFAEGEEFATSDSTTGLDSAPTIDLRLGRIQDEDDESLVGGELGACVARFNINDRFTVWVDRDGNYQTRVVGTNKNEYFGFQDNVHNASLRQVVKGTLTSRLQSRILDVKSTDTVTVGSDRTVTVGGVLTEIAKKNVIRQGGSLQEDYKGVERSVAGGVDESITGPVTQTIGDNRAISVMGDSSEVVAGTKSLTIAKAEVNPNPLTKSYAIYIGSGVFSVHDALGKIVFSSGNIDPEAALATLMLKPTGSIKLLAGPGPIHPVSLEVNPLGAQIKTAAGVISIDNTGTVLLGPPVRGAVLTTLTQPACLVTGTPTIGASSVQAGGIPQLALPPVSLPSTFVPDRVL